MAHRLAVVATATLALVVAVGSSQAVAASLTLRADHAQIDAGTAPTFTFSAGRSAGALVLQKQVGSAKVWRSVARPTRRAGVIVAPKLAQGAHHYRLARVRGRVVFRRSPAVLVRAYANMSLSRIHPGSGGTLNFQEHLFVYDVSTLNNGVAPCHCVPPLAPDHMVLASMSATTCRSADLTVVAPWASDGLGGSDSATIVQATADPQTVTVASGSPTGSLRAALTGGPWELDASTVSANVNGNQATVYIAGTLSCYTSTGI